MPPMSFEEIELALLEAKAIILSNPRSDLPRQQCSLCDEMILTDVEKFWYAEFDDEDRPRLYFHEGCFFPSEDSSKT